MEMKLELDADGFMHNHKDWTPDAAVYLASLNDIKLEQEHWEIINLVQSYYEQFAMSPNQRPFVKYIAQHLGTAKGNSRYLMKLFKGSPAKTASQIAGLPKPSLCF